MADNLTQWLRDEASFAYHRAEEDMLTEAADLIETQAREIERLQATLRHIARTKIEMVKADHANITLPFELPYFSAQQCWDMARAALGESHD